MASLVILYSPSGVNVCHCVALRQNGDLSRVYLASTQLGWDRLQQHCESGKDLVGSEDRWIEKGREVELRGKNTMWVNNNLKQYVQCATELFLSILWSLCIF